MVACSSAEAEFQALSHGICEGVWLKKLLDELKMEDCGPVELMCDNQTAISISKNPVHRDQTKHVEVDRHFISKKIENKIINVR